MNTNDNPDHRAGAAEEPQEPRVVVYLRTVNHNQLRVDDPRLLSEQLRLCQHKAQELGTNKVTVYVDVGKPVRAADRPALQDMLRYVEEQHPDYVIVHRLDRLSRKVAELRQIEQRIEDAGARLVSVCINDNDEGSAS